MGQLLEALRSNHPSITGLIFKSQGYGGESILVSEPINNLQCYITREQMIFFVEALKSITSLKRLEFISIRNMSREILREIGIAIKENTSLEHLSFHDCRIGAEGVKVLVPYLRENPSLQSLDF